ncbi:HU family DNA-binding protein [Rhabdothermincola salaria]|uniref:HU family DNA-binding protein n=1 Tax=Rhabdothermincola salaria TaxID=2903142 RepID=UPI001E2DFC48|nr:HU family DNA-binding protein [Rhabdothermincola salaria]
MNKRELAAAIAVRLDKDRTEVEAVLNEAIGTITDTVAGGEQVVLTGFAKFARVQRGARMARNPQTGAAVKVPAKKAVRITPLKSLKDTVATGKPAKKAAAKKTAAKKTAAKKAPAKKTAAKKAPAKKTAAKKAPAKKTAAKKAPAKKAPAKKAPAKKAPAKKAPAKK